MGYFEKQFTLSSWEVDPRQWMRLSAILRHMQEIAGRHLASLGYPYARLLEDEQVFLLAKMEVTMAGSPRPEDLVTVRTRPHPAKGVSFIRESQLCVDGKPLVFGSAAWILANSRTHQPLRPSVFGWDYPFDPVEFDNSIARKRIPQPDNIQSLGERVIRYSDLDGNRHMNNAVYGDLIFDFLPAGWMADHSFRKATILYEREAKLGDTLQMVGCQTAEDSWYLAGMRDGTRCFAAEIQF